jgi:hypothetical protein
VSVLADKDLTMNTDGTSRPAAEHSDEKLETAIRNATQEQLGDAIRKRALWDEGFRAELLMRLGAPDLKEALNAAKERVRIAIRQNTSHGYIDWNGCDDICLEISDCLDTATSLYMDQYPEILFEIALHLFTTGAKLTSTADSSSGALSSVIHETSTRLENTCRKLMLSEDAKLKKSCYEKLCKEAFNKALDGWDEWSYELLVIAALFVTHKNVQKLDTALDEMKRRIEQRNYSSNSYLMFEAMVRLRMTDLLEGKAAARAFINAHIDMDEMRLLAIHLDMENGEYQNAERLCLEKIGSTDSHPYRPNEQWLSLLFAIYEATGEKQKQINIADRLVCQGRLEYYDKMKALYADEWKDVYPGIRQRYKASLPRHTYMYILNAECEWLLLLNEVLQQPSAVFQYGKALSEYAPDVVYGIYRAEITNAAAAASDRREYKKVCSAIRELSKSGGTEEALKLIGELADAYKRRPAMIEELNSLLQKLRK